MMTAEEKEHRLQILSAPSKKLDDDKFREWMRLTLFYTAFGCGVAPSHAAINMQLDAMKLETMDGNRQNSAAIAAISIGGVGINEVMKELAQ
jgi:hypothetical protein